MYRIAIILAAAVAAGWVVGCRKADTASRPAAPSLIAQLTSIAKARRETPAFSEYTVPPQPTITPEIIAHGKTIYERACVMCHGVEGNAQTEISTNLHPRPRNFQAAKYRLRSTLTGQLPADEDLYRSVSLGMPGTLMLPWLRLMQPEEIWAVVSYIKTFSPRFEDENEERTLVDLGTPPARAPQLIDQGKQFYQKFSCYACHGEQGRGDGFAAASLTDDSDMRIKPRDFTQPATFKSGYSTRDMVRTMLTGFDGTPMAGFHGTLSTEQAWQIAYFLESLGQPALPANVLASQSAAPRDGAVGRSCVR